MSKQRIAVTWEAAGYIEVEANSIEEAMKKVKENARLVNTKEKGLCQCFLNI